MNSMAALKAAGVYLAVVAVVAAWIVGIVSAAITHVDAWIFLATFAPILLLIAGALVMWCIVEPVIALYRHFDKAARK